MTWKQAFSTLSMLLAISALKPAHALADEPAREVAASEVAASEVAASETAPVAVAADDGVIVVELEDADAPAIRPGKFDFVVPAPPHVAQARAVAGRRIIVPPGKFLFTADLETPAPGQPVVRPMEAKIEMKKVAYLGVTTSSVSPQLASHLKLTEGFGLVVDHVQPEEPAHKAGLKSHDVLVKLGDQKLVNAMQLGTLVRAQKPGDDVELTVIREGKELTIKATLVEKEMPVMAGTIGDVLMTAPMPGGDFARAVWLQREGHDPAVMLRALPRGSIRYADGEHQLEIQDGKEGRRLIVKDKAGKEIFSGPIDTPEHRKAVPESIMPKLEKLEKSTRIKLGGGHSLPADFDAVQLVPLEGPELDLDLKLQGTHDLQELMESIREQLKNLKLDGGEQGDAQKQLDTVRARIEAQMTEMKKQHEARLKAIREQHEALRGRAAPAGGEFREHRVQQAQAMARMKDGEHDITLKTTATGKHLTIKDNTGNEIFSGPVNTDEERSKIPQDLRAKVDRLESKVRVQTPGESTKQPEERRRTEKHEDQ